jgi:hypothetical protein
VIGELPLQLTGALVLIRLSKRFIFGLIGAMDGSILYADRLPKQVNPFPLPVSRDMGRDGRVKHLRGRIDHEKVFGESKHGQL